MTRRYSSWASKKADGRDIDETVDTHGRRLWCPIARRYMDSLGRIDVKGTGIKTEVNKMMAMGIIEPSKSPFCCPLLLIKKADGYLKQMNELIVFSSLWDEHMNSLKKNSVASRMRRLR